MSDIDRDSLGWIGYKLLCAHAGLSEGTAQLNWRDLDLRSRWEAAAEAIAREAVDRYKATQVQASEPAPKPSYGNFLEITRIMSGG